MTRRGLLQLLFGGIASAVVPAPIMPRRESAAEVHAAFEEWCAVNSRPPLFDNSWIDRGMRARLLAVDWTEVA